MRIFLASILIVLNLSFVVSAQAASMSESDSLANLQLAMLTLSEKKSPPTKNISEKRSTKTLQQSVKQIKSSVTIYPRNCLDWNASEINRKAKSHSKPITKYSRLYRVDSNLIKSIITAESCFRTKALSHKGASGLMQLIPATAERFGVKDIYNTEQNIRGGTKYLQFLLARYKGNLRKSIAAYNAGEGAVDRYKGIPPYRETKQYVKNVLKIYRLLMPPKKTKILVAKAVKAKKTGVNVVTKAKRRVMVVYQPPKLGKKPGRHGWQYNRRLAPHLYKH